MFGYDCALFTGAVEKNDGTPLVARLFRTPSRVAMAREELGRAQSAFERLPDRYREAILLHKVDGLTHAEIADRMHTSEGAARNLVYRGLAAIGRALDEDQAPDGTP